MQHRDGFDLEWRGYYVPTLFPKRHREFVRLSVRPTWPGKAEASARAAIAAGATVILCGKRGTGKTQMAACIAAEYPPRKVLYFTAGDLFRTIKAWFDLPSRDQDHNRRMLSTCPLLVIDELHDRLDTEFEANELNALIDKRYGARLPTVLIANLKPDALETNLGASIVSRVQEGGAVVRCDWSSFRAPTAGGVA